MRKKGDHVVGIDNFNDYYPPSLKKARAKKLEEIGVQVLECDLLNLNSLFPLFEKKRFSHFVHLAAQAGVRFSTTHPFAYSTANLEGFLSAIELCHAFQPLPFIYASSSSVYGTNKKFPFAESDPTDHPASLYGATKKGGEMIAYCYHTLYNIPVCGLRYFTVYGPWGRPDMAYFSFTQAILKGDPISLFNHGEMKRDFTYIDDIIEGTSAAIDLSPPCEIFNLGNHRSEKLLTLVRLLENYLKKKAKIELKPMQLGDVKETFADISKAEKLLHFHPKTTLEEGLKKFVEWFKDYSK